MRFTFFFPNPYTAARPGRRVMKALSYAQGLTLLPAPDGLHRLRF